MENTINTIDRISAVYDIWRYKILPNLTRNEILKLMMVCHDWLSIVIQYFQEIGLILELNRVTAEECQQIISGFQYLDPTFKVSLTPQGRIPLTQCYHHVVEMTVIGNHDLMPLVKATWLKSLTIIKKNNKQFELKLPRLEGLTYLKLVACFWEKKHVDIDANDIVPNLETFHLEKSTNIYLDFRYHNHLRNLQYKSMVNRLDFEYINVDTIKSLQLHQPGCVSMPYVFPQLEEFDTQLISRDCIIPCLPVVKDLRIVATHIKSKDDAISLTNNMYIFRYPTLQILKINYSRRNYSRRNYSVDISNLVDLRHFSGNIPLKSQRELPNLKSVSLDSLSYLSDIPRPHVTKICFTGSGIYERYQNNYINLSQITILHCILSVSIMYNYISLSGFSNLKQLCINNVSSLHHVKDAPNIEDLRIINCSARIDTGNFPKLRYLFAYGYCGEFIDTTHNTLEMSSIYSCELDNYMSADRVSNIFEMDVLELHSKKPDFFS